jgi:hypothetical protein
MSGECQKTFDGPTDIQDRSERYGMFILFSKAPAHVANKSIDQRRGDVNMNHVSIEEPLMEVSIVASRLADAVDVQLPVEQAPQIRLPGLGQMWEPLGKGVRRLFKDFAQGLLIGRIGWIRPKEVFVHGTILRKDLAAEN